VEVTIFPVAGVALITMVAIYYIWVRKLANT
jgi:hypothetical protein